ncbi:MAG: hypothetical protein K5905_30770, partial [Roseibium sp.]|uniref:hypothetical protein n=1 Tax=Roseibium sp. TaxID=1936156 RepID=UPI002609113B
MRRPLSAMILAGLFFFVCTSIYVLAREASIFFNGSTTPAARFESKVEGTIPYGLSAFSQQIALRDCDDSLKSQYSRSQTRERRSTAMKHCRDFALTLTKDSPANGLAWFIAAQASAWLKDYSDM